MAEGTSAAFRPLAIADLQGQRSATLQFLPALQPHFDRFAAALLGELAPLAGAGARLEVDTLEPAGDKADIFASDVHWLSQPFMSQDGTAGIVARLDQNFLYTFCELAFGGDGSAEAYASERGRSRIENGLAEFLFAAVARHLPAAFPALPPAAAAFVADRSGDAPRDPVVAEVSLLLSVFGYGGEMNLGLSKQALALYREDGPAAGVEAAVTPHPAWGARIRDSLGRSDLELSAILCESDLSLAAIAGFEPGMVIEIPVRLDTPLKVFCAGQHLLDASFSRSGQAYTLLVDRIISLG